MKKKLLTLSLIVICVAILAAGTLAYFSDDVTAHNVITTGGVDIELVETGEDGKPFPEEGITGVMPGQTVTKVVTVDNIGPADAWIRLEAELEVLGADGKPLDDAPVTMDVGSKWTEKDGYYYYKFALAPGQSTDAFITGVTFSGPDMDNKYQNCTVNLDITAYAVQVDNNGDTVWEAQGWPEPTQN